MEPGSSEGINVYADAKTEYTRQLTQFCLQAFLGYYLKMLEETKISEKDPKKLLLSFQHSLKNIPEWNFEKVQKETTNILKDINCDYFEDLLSAVFVAHTKVLSAIRLTTKQKKLQITIPKVDHFLHHTLIECARILWSNVFLFSPSGSSIDRQKNLRHIEQLIQDGILQSIRSMLPVKNILKEYLKDDDDEDEDIKEETKEEEAKVEEKKVEEKKVEEAKVEEKKEEEVKVEEVKKEEIKVDDVKIEEVKIEEVKIEEVKVDDVKEEEIKVEEVKVEEVKENITLPAEESTTTNEVQTIQIDTEPSVHFAEINQVFDIESNKEDNKDEDEDQDQDNLIEILDTEGTVVDDYDDLEKKEDEVEFETLE